MRFTVNIGVRDAGNPRRFNSPVVKSSDKVDCCINLVQVLMLSFSLEPCEVSVLAMSSPQLIIVNGFENCVCS